MIGRVTAVVVAAGSGERYGGTIPKQWLDLNGYPVWIHSVLTLLGEPEIAQLIVTFSPKQLVQMEHCIPSFIKHHPRCVFTAGGKTRAQSVERGLVLAEHDWVLIHDAVRPGLTSTHLRTLWRAAEQGSSDAFSLGIPVVDSLAYVDHAERLTRHVSRKQCWRVFTPQLFRTAHLRAAFAQAAVGGGSNHFSDETQLMQAAGFTCQMVRGSVFDLKVTYPEDLELLKRMQGRLAVSKVQNAALRVGHGFDLHAFKGNKPLKLAGVQIIGAPCVQAHSDGDVLIHAVIDALLGATGLGDIGRWFPDHDQRFSDVSSARLLEETCAIIYRERGPISILNLDMVIFLEHPRLDPYREQITQSLAFLLQLSMEQVNLKATTLEGQGSIGRGEAVAAEAVVLLNVGHLSNNHA